MSLTPKNWDEFQHYKGRRPPWIKLHRGLLDDYEFACLPVASKALAPLLWLLASEYPEGNITASMEEIAFRLRMPVGDVEEAIKPLVEAGFFTSASTMLARCKQDAMPEREKETEKEKKDTPTGVPSKYAFESGVIRLNEKDLVRWKASFSHLDVPAELIGLTQWAGEQPKWFHAVAGALAKRNREEGRRREASARAGPIVLTPSGNPWPEGIT